MRQAQETIEVRTPGRGLVDITAAVGEVVRRSGVLVGTCTAFCRHTSAALVIQENADPSARADLLAWLDRVAPDGDPHYSHDSEGPDDMSAHLRSALLRTSETLPVMHGRLSLGTWQGLFLVENRRRAHVREVVVHVVGL
jgi:secondary thiamine-phosphate synthase enzyme